MLRCINLFNWTNYKCKGGGCSWGFEPCDTSDSIKVQSVNPMDFEAEITRLYERAYRGLEEYADTDPEDIKRYLKWLYRRAEGGFLAAFEGSRIVGFVSTDHKWASPEGHIVGEIHEIVVDPSYQGHGIGKLLLMEAINLLTQKGVKIIELWAGEKNFHAQDFYKSQGFLEMERRGRWIRFIKDLEEQERA